MAKFVLTIESDNPEEIASFLSPSRTVTSTVEPSSEPLPKSETQSEEPKKRGRPAKATTEQSSELLSTDTSSDPINTPSISPSSTADTASPDPGALLDEVKALIMEAVSTKSAKETVSLLTEKCGTPAPQAMNPTQLAAAKTALEGLLNG